MNLKDVNIAKSARNMAYAPYSNFKVGAVLKTKNGKIFTGCNIENAGIESICAERVAFCKAISEGEKEFESILIVGSKANEEPNKECLPCGYCRQFMSEFVDENFKIYTINNNNFREYSLKELLPYTFKL